MSKLAYAVAIWDVIQATHMRGQTLRTEKTKRTRTSIGGSGRVVLHLDYPSVSVAKDSKL